MAEPTTPPSGGAGPERRTGMSGSDKMAMLKAKMQTTCRELHKSSREQSLVQQDLSSLKEKLSSIGSQVTTLKKNVDGLAQDYNTVVRRDVSEYMQAVLPRELRDMIYNYVVDIVWWMTPFTYDFNFGCSVHRSCYEFHDVEDPHGVLHLPPNCLPKFAFAKTFDEMDPEKNTLRELAETWYSRRNYPFESPKAFKRFSRTDLSGTGLDPKNYTKAIAMVLFLDMDSTFIDFNIALEEHLKSLLALKPGAKFGLRLVPGRNHQGKLYKLPRLLLSYLFNILKKLEKAGFENLVIPWNLHHFNDAKTAVKHLRGPLPDIDEWIKKTRIVQRIIYGRDKDRTGSQMSSEDQNGLKCSRVDFGGYYGGTVETQQQIRHFDALRQRLG
ncbi:hypothetical protein BKA63DRAFT_569168 [Paraphoma chrysanthemicola]|nr:hypothetical protein BKA63DRAFT_569168 [Paraphoma chrysanthemicola]